MKRTPIRRISNKRAQQNRKEAELKIKLLDRCQGLCEECGKSPTEFPFTLDKHEIVFRSHGGDPLDPDNCLMLCRQCHDKKHHK